MIKDSNYWGSSDGARRLGSDVEGSLMLDKLIQEIQTLQPVFTKVSHYPDTDYYLDISDFECECIELLIDEVRAGGSVNNFDIVHALLEVKHTSMKAFMESDGYFVGMDVESPNLDSLIRYVRGNVD